MINIDKVTKIYNVTKGKEVNQLIALNDIALKIDKGDSVGLIGQNGAGKTTLLKLLSCLIEPTSGTARVNGLDTVKDSKLVRKSIGLLLGSDPNLYNRLTSYENIEYFAELNGMDKPDIKTAIEDLAHELNFTEYLYRRTENFSRGMKQKICFARSVIHNPSLILLDEPSSGLDVSGIKEVSSFVKKYKELGKTFIVSSHNMNEIEELCNKVIIMNKGKIIEYDLLTNILKKYQTNDLSKIVFTSIGGF
jgi:sodium transport system ATP-binding protein